MPVCGMDKFSNKRFGILERKGLSHRWVRRALATGLAYSKSGRPHAILPCMSHQGSDDDQVEQRMDALVLRLLKTPPQSRAELAEAVRRAKGKPKRIRARRATERKRPAAS